LTPSTALLKAWHDDLTTATVSLKVRHGHLPASPIASGAWHFALAGLNMKRESLHVLFGRTDIFLRPVQ
jgi:hypothetical protein